MVKYLCFSTSFTSPYKLLKVVIASSRTGSWIQYQLNLSDLKIIPRKEHCLNPPSDLTERPGEQDIACTAEQESHIPAARHEKNWSAALQHGSNHPTPHGASSPRTTDFVIPRGTNCLSEAEQQLHPRVLETFTPGHNPCPWDQKQHKVLIIYC